MTEATRINTDSGYGAVSVALFLCLFAGQAALIAMSPVLADAASDLHVSTAAAGQLRTITGLAAGIAALMLTTVAGRIGLGRQLLAASALLALGSSRARLRRPSRCWRSPSCRSASPSPC